MNVLWTGAELVAVAVVAVAVLTAPGLAAPGLAAPAASKPLPSQPAVDAPVGIALTPNFVERDLPGRDIDLTFTLTNAEPAARAIDLSVVQLSHDLDGTPVYGEPIPSMRAEPPRAVIVPGARQEIRVVGALPEDETSVAAALLAEPDIAGGTGNVVVRSRVAAFLLLRAPRPWHETISIGEVGVEQAADGYQSYVVVRNTGDVWMRPNETIDLAAHGGEGLGRVQLTGQLILPGSARKLVGGPVDGNAASMPLAGPAAPGPPRTAPIAFALTALLGSAGLLVTWWRRDRAGQPVATAPPPERAARRAPARRRG